MRRVFYLQVHVKLITDFIANIVKHSAGLVTESEFGVAQSNAPSVTSILWKPTNTEFQVTRRRDQYRSSIKERFDEDIAVAVLFRQVRPVAMRVRIFILGPPRL